MPKPEDIDLLSTHKYIMETADLLADVQSHNFVHEVASVELTPTAHVPVYHHLESSLIVPLRRQPETGQPRINGDQRLNFALWSPPVDNPGPSIPGRTIRYREDGQKQVQFASFHARFNTKRVKSISASLTADGEQAGLQEADVADVLPLYFVREAGIRARSIQSIASFTKAISLTTGGSREVLKSVIDFRRYARAIEHASGLAIPPSLTIKHSPFATVDQWARLQADSDSPEMATTTITVDNFDYAARKRHFTRYVMKQFDGWTPQYLNEEPLALYGVRTLGGEETGTSFEIEVSHQTLSTDEDDLVNAQTPQEARQMMGSFIRAMTNLRRYDNRAAKLLGIPRAA